MDLGSSDFYYDSTINIIRLSQHLQNDAMRKEQLEVNYCEANKIFFFILQ